MTEVIRCDGCAGYFPKTHESDITRIEVSRPFYEYEVRHFCPKCMGKVAEFLGIEFQKEEFKKVCKCGCGCE